uniref:Ovule protein n=1 Tax=Ditylenchus dipsaci TaxID=166011 RepID=A0A915EQH8_9BILA
MDLYLFDHAKFLQLYNCSLYKVEDVPMKKEAILLWVSAFWLCSLFLRYYMFLCNCYMASSVIALLQVHVFVGSQICWC